MLLYLLLNLPWDGAPAVLKRGNVWTQVEKGKRRAEQMWTREEAVNMTLEQQPIGQAGKAIGLEPRLASPRPHLIVLPSSYSFIWQTFIEAHAARLAVFWVLGASSDRDRQKLRLKEPIK